MHGWGHHPQQEIEDPEVSNQMVPVWSPRDAEELAELADQFEAEAGEVDA